MRTDSASTSARRGVAVVGIDAHEPALGLRDDLLGDDEAVAVEQRRVLRGGGVGDQRRERVVGADLGDAVDRDEGERLHVVGRIRRRRRACRGERGGDARVGHQRVGDDRAHAERLDLAGARGVAGVDHERAAELAVLARDADARHVDARAGP